MNERIYQCTGKEEIEELLEIVSSCLCDDIIFQFPRTSILFHQKTNLQKLHAFAEKHKKNIIIVTQNARARKEIQSIGIHSIASILDKQTIVPTSIAPIPIIPKISNHPIDPEKFRIKNKETFPSDIIQKISKPSLHSLFLLGIFTIILFVFVVYLTIPNATIFITPQRKEIEMHINTELLSLDSYQEADLWKSTNGIFMTPIETTFEYKGIYTDVFKQVEGENAHGRILIINKGTEDMILKDGTRVQTKEGILFLLSHWVKVPANGTLEVNVKASDLDVYRKVQADRANIKKDEILFFPGLSLDAQKKVYAVTVEDFSGGRGTWKYSVSSENIADAKKQWEEEAKKQVESEILKKLEEIQLQKPEEKLRLILPMDQYLFFEIQNYWFDESEDTLLSKAIPSFSGGIRVNVKAYAYSIQKMEEIIYSKFARLAPDGMKLLTINNDLLLVNIQTINTEKNKIKASVSTRGIYEFVVEPRSEKAKLFIDTAKQAILGKSKEEAKTILLNNFKEVSDVEISLFPFWNTTIPSLPEKITFTILE